MMNPGAAHDFSWTIGGGKGTLTLAITRDRGHIAVVTYGPGLRPEQLAGLHVEVDGVRVPHEVREDINPKCIVARVPPSPAPRGTTTEIALVVPRGAAPAFSASVIPEEPSLRQPSRSGWRRFAGLVKRQDWSFPLSHFDGRAYLKANPDVAGAVAAGTVASGLEHYRRHGLKEGRPYALAWTGEPNEWGPADALHSSASERRGRGRGAKTRCRAAQAGESWSQLGQDRWVIERSGFKTGGYFVEIGATDGIKLSNTYLLETRYAWNGICVEPDPVAFARLTENRKAYCTTACIWSESGETLDFILAKVNGAVARVADRDHHAPKRKAFETMGQTIQVSTLSLNDLLDQAGAPHSIDYISIDTEGAEYEILSTFDFNRWKVALWTIEHNYTAQRDRVYELMTAHGYTRVKVRFDDWYYLSPHAA